MGKILPLRIEWIHSERPDFYVEEAAELQDLIRKLKQGRDFFVGDIEGKAAGYCSGTDMADIYVSEGVFVSKDFRGQGIGPALKKAQVEHARRSHYDAIISHVMPNNFPSIRVHEKIGARISTEFSSYAMHDTYVVDFRIKP